MPRDSPHTPVEPAGLGSPRFVRREGPLRWCRDILSAANSGQPRVALVVGEPGVGKTRLIQELCSLAAARGFTVHVGRAAEGSAVPFLPFRNALASVLPPPRHRRGRAASLDERIVRRFLRGDGMRPAAAPAGDPAGTSARLASAIVSVTLDAARRHALLLVLDDLHWADAATLEAFELLAFTLADAGTAARSVPCLVVAGLRPPEPEQQRAARVLSRLSRETACDTISLGGLDEDELAGLLATLVARTPTHQLVAMVHRATGGNPLFAHEVVRHLERIGALHPQGRFVTIKTTMVEVPLPADLRAALHDRIMRIAPAARDLLTLGAVLGDPFDLEALRAVARIAPSALNAMHEAWLVASLTVSDGSSVHFAHPLIRQGLLGELSTARRMRLHAEVADGLETLSTGTDRELEIAHHLVAAGPLVHPLRTMTACTRAGELAGYRHAWTDAARFYEAALGAAERCEPPPSDRRLGDLHYRVGFAHYRDQDAGACLDRFDAAASYARAAGDLPALARALLGRIRAQFTLVSVGYGARIDTAELETVVERIASDEPVLAGFATSEMAQVLWTARQPAAARAHAERALAIGTHANAHMLVAEAHRALSLIDAQELDPPGALAHLDAGLAAARRGREPWIESQILQRRILPLLWLGQTDQVERSAADAGASTELIHDWGDHSLAHGGLTCWAVLIGDFPRAEGHAKEALRLLRRSGYPWSAPTALPAIALARALCGSWQEADAALALLAEPGEIFETPGADVVGMAFVYRLVLSAWKSASERDVVRERLEPLVADLVAGVQEDVYALGLAAAVVDCAALLESAALAEPFHALFLRAHDRGLVTTTGWVALVPRLLGLTSTVLGRREEAQRWFERALGTSRAMRARTEYLRTAVAYARLLARSRPGAPDQRPRALELLMLAVPELRQLGFRPLLADATELGRVLSPPASRSRGTPAGRPRRAGTTIALSGPLLAIMFTDIEGSTAAYDRLGDTAGRALVRAHDDIVRDALALHDGTLMKHTGDGAEAAFPSVSAAIEGAIAMQRRFARHSRRYPARVLRVRIGIHVGEPLAEDGDLFGTAVNVAARVCARARGGEILVTSPARQAAGPERFRFRARGRTSLRGLRTPVRLFLVAW